MFAVLFSANQGCCCDIFFSTQCPLAESPLLLPLSMGSIRRNRGNDREAKDQWKEVATA